MSEGDDFDFGKLTPTEQALCRVLWECACGIEAATRNDMDTASNHFTWAARIADRVTEQEVKP